jgi:hypothetical protein
MAHPTTRSYAVGQFEFSLDGEAPFYVKSLEGGLPKGNVVEEQIGTDVEFIKHLSTVEIEPLSVEIGMQESISMLRWIQKSWRKEFDRKAGWISHANFDMKEVLQTHFSEALITETTFPTLDGSSKEMATLKVKMQPEAVEFANGSNNRVHASSRHHERQKLWPASAFAFELHNVDVRHTTKIDSFTVKQGIKSYSTGRARFPHWEPTKLTFPDLSIYVPLAYADSLLDWYQRSMKGGKDPKLQTHGSIRYLAPNKKDTVFEIDLYHVGIKGVTIDKSERQDQVKKVKADLYVSRMDLVLQGVLATQG